jgi:hypothetical protein
VNAVVAAISPDEQVLRSQLASAREKIHGLVRELRSIDGELEGLSAERTRHQCLQSACEALEQLGALGAAELFWGDAAAAGRGVQQVRMARGRVDAFQKRLDEIDEKRQAVLEQIEQQQQVTELLEDDVFELECQEERRRLEWIPERELGVLPGRALVMPWTRAGEEDERFRKWMTGSLLLSLMLGFLIPLIPLPVPELEDPVEIPERLTRLIMESRPLPPPPAQPVPPDPQQLSDTEAEPVPKKTREGPGAGPKEGPGKGILAFRESFAGVAENQTIARLGAQARISSPGAAASGVIQRSMVATQAPGSSGGINLAELSRGVAGGGGGGGGRIERVQIARATSTIGGGGGRGASSVDGGGPPLGRTDEEIQIVFDRHKAGLYRLYNRELRNDPTLKGQMVLRIRIEPDGRVTLCELHGSDMNAPQLAAQVLERVRSFDFGAKEGIPAITILYPIDFLPAT